ncbi:hypothetical protein DBR42_09115 [Pelomonas sp. HMWF004]|nr:hypothetical protein DBR42_09115 [Pelomonas sp. HMWF004]
MRVTRPNFSGQICQIKERLTMWPTYWGYGAGTVMTMDLQFIAPLSVGSAHAMIKRKLLLP